MNDTNYDLRKENQLKRPKVNTEIYGRSFRYQGAKLWNTLPNDVTNIENTEDFKRVVKDCLPKLCTCNSCIMCKINSIDGCPFRRAYTLQSPTPTTFNLLMLVLCLAARLVDSGYHVVVSCEHVIYG